MTENTSPTVPAVDRPQRRSGAALAGLILMALGATFLLQSLGLLGRNFNWWAIFILIPALTTLWAAGVAFSRGGMRFNAAVRGSLGGGLIILAVALMFLLGLDWGVWWPLMLIVPGLAIFINGFSDSANVSAAALANMNFWTGVAVAGLGTAFLLNNLHALSLRALFGAFQWWGIFVLIPGLGALFNAGVVFWKSGRRFNLAARGLLAAGLATCAVAAVALLGLDWNLLTPIILIAAGLVMLIGFGENK